MIVWMKNIVQEKFPSCSYWKMVPITESEYKNKKQLYGICMHKKNRSTVDNEYNIEHINFMVTM